jgi:hypothetical protein
MFPFEGMLKDVAAVNHYSKSHIFEHAFKWKHVFVFNQESCGTVILGILKKVKTRLVKSGMYSYVTNMGRQINDM